MNLIPINGIDITIISVYIAALLAIGFFYKKKHTNANPAEVLFLSGRSLKWYQVGFSIFSTNVSPMYLVGYCGIAYTTGMVTANFDWLAWGFLMLLCFVFIPHYLTNKISTMPEFLLRRYGKLSHAFMSYYTMFSTLIVWVSFVLFTGGIVVAQITGVSFWVAALIIALLAISYTVKGGLGAIVRTGLFQSVIVIGVTIILGILALIKIGGISELYAKTPKEFWSIFRPSTDKEYPWHAIILGYPVIGIWYWCTDQTIVQRTLAAKNIAEGQKGAWLVALLKALMPFIFLMPGIYCLILYPHLQNPDHAYVTIISGVLPVGLIGLALGALIAALMNDVAMGLNAFSTVFSMDVYARKINPNATPEDISRVGKWVIVISAAIAVLLAILISRSGKGLFNLSQAVGVFLAPPLSAVFLLGVLWKRATARAAELTLFIGSAVCLGIGICHVTDYPQKDFWPHYMLMAFYMMVALVLFMIIVSLLTPRPPKQFELATLKESYNQSNARFSFLIVGMWLLLAVGMFILYYLFR